MQRINGDIKGCAATYGSLGFKAGSSLVLLVGHAFLNTSRLKEV